MGNQASSQSPTATDHDEDVSSTASSELGNSAALRRARAAHLTPDELAQLPLVSHYTYACLCEYVYKEADRRPLPPGWGVLLDASDCHLDREGYYGAAFVNDELRACVIAQRGTTTAEGLRAGVWVYFDEPTIQFHLAAQFSKLVRLRLQMRRPGCLPEDDAGELSAGPGNIYTISYTGHSLGAVIAACRAAEEHTFAVTFESPGCKKFVEQTMHPFKAEDIDVVTYLRNPNPVNSLKPHCGFLVQLPSHADDPRKIVDIKKATSSGDDDAQQQTQQQSQQQQARQQQQQQQAPQTVSGRMGALFRRRATAPSLLSSSATTASAASRSSSSAAETKESGGDKSKNKTKEDGDGTTTKKSSTPDNNKKSSTAAADSKKSTSNEQQKQQQQKSTDTKSNSTAVALAPRKKKTPYRPFGMPINLSNIWGAQDFLRVRLLEATLPELQLYLTKLEPTLRELVDYTTQAHSISAICDIMEMGERTHMGQQVVLRWPENLFQFVEYYNIIRELNVIWEENTTDAARGKLVHALNAYKGLLSKLWQTEARPRYKLPMRFLNRHSRTLLELVMATNSSAASASQHHGAAMFGATVSPHPHQHAGLGGYFAELDAVPLRPVDRRVLMTVAVDSDNMVSTALSAFQMKQFLAVVTQRASVRIALEKWAATRTAHRSKI